MMNPKSATRLVAAAALALSMAACASNPSQRAAAPHPTPVDQGNPPGGSSVSNMGAAGANAPIGVTGVTGGQGGTPRN